MLLSLGSIGDEVKEIQTRLGVTPVDGIFGAKTYEAVIKFQRDSKTLEIDGIVGPLTAAKLGIFPNLIALLRDANKKFWDKLRA